MANKLDTSDRVAEKHPMRPPWKPWESAVWLGASGVILALVIVIAGNA
jgi:hypothetical protein